jgi:hypothetical protein
MAACAKGKEIELRELSRGCSRGQLSARVARNLAAINQNRTTNNEAYPSLGWGPRQCQSGGPNAHPCAPCVGQCEHRVHAYQTFWQMLTGDQRV